jgi:tyrosine-protein kinase Etk/Wzc
MTSTASVSESQLAASVESNAPENAESEVSFLDLLTVVAWRKWQIAKITGIFVLLAIVISLVLPKRYTATVSLMPPQQTTSLSGALTAQLGSLGSVASLASGGLGLKNPNEMYVAMFRSRTVEDAMIQHFGLDSEYHQKLISDARKAFEKHSSVDGNGKDGLIRVSVEDPDPNRAAELANGYVDQFRKLSEHLAITEAGQRRLFFEQQLQQAKDKLADAEQALQQTEIRTGVIQLDAQAKALIESTASLGAQIAAKEVQIQSLRTYATNENAQLVQAQEELRGLRVQLAKLSGNDDKFDHGEIVPKGRVPQVGLEYTRKFRDVKYQETIFDILARQFEVAKLDEAKQGSVIQVVDVAVPPDKRSFPKRGLIVLGSTVLGFLIGTFAAFFDAGLKRMMDHPKRAAKVRALRTAFWISRTEQNTKKSASAAG